MILFRYWTSQLETKLSGKIRPAQQFQQLLDEQGKHEKTASAIARSEGNIVNKYDDALPFRFDPDRNRTITYIHVGKTGYVTRNDGKYRKLSGQNIKRFKAIFAIWLLLTHLSLFHAVPTTTSAARR